MVDKKNKTDSPDNDLVSLAQPQDVRDWCKALHCTEKQLREAVWKVGNSARQIRQYLAAQKRSAL